MPRVKEQVSYEAAALHFLISEFPHTDPKTTEKKINRKLRRDKLGAYDLERIDRLRRLKNEVVAELVKPETSRYYSKGPSEYADLNDFEIERMIKFWRTRFAEVEEDDMQSFIFNAVYLYYLR